MKSNTLRIVLQWALLTSLILSSFFFVKYFFRSRELQTLRPQYQNESMKYQSAHNLITPLVSDVVEYSKRDPGVLPILDLIGYKPGKPAPPVAPKAAGAK